MYNYKLSWMGKSRNEKETKTAQISVHTQMKNLSVLCDSNERSEWAVNINQHTCIAKLGPSA
jgi:hypothetical protein